DQDVGQQCELEVSPDRHEAFEELLPLVVAQEQVPRVAAVGGEMVDAPVEPSGRPRHMLEARAPSVRTALPRRSRRVLVPLSCDLRLTTRSVSPGGADAWPEAWGLGGRWV